MASDTSLHKQEPSLLVACSHPLFARWVLVIQSTSQKSHYNCPLLASSYISLNALFERMKWSKREELWLILIQSLWVSVKSVNCRFWMFGKFLTFESPITSSADYIFIKLHKIKYNRSCKLWRHWGSEGRRREGRKRDREVKPLHTFLWALRCGGEGHPGVIRRSPKPADPTDLQNVSPTSAQDCQQKWSKTNQQRIRQTI